jgi:Rrf2 family protein
MYELALRYGEGPVILKDIARWQEISEKYLSKLIIPLKAAKLVRASRGSHGGYNLTREPSEISIREIVEVLEGDLRTVECVDNGNTCTRSQDCPVKEIWQRLDKSVLDVLDNIKLSDVVKNRISNNA